MAAPSTPTADLATRRRLAAQIGAYSRAAQYDGREVTEAARAAFRDSFLKQIPEDLPEPERQRRAAALRKALDARMALRSAKVRARKAGRRRQPLEAPP